MTVASLTSTIALKPILSSYSLANVLYDTTEKKYYTPNTGALMDMSKNSENGGENNENTGKQDKPDGHFRAILL